MKRFFKKWRFEHRQGSEYISRDKLAQTDIADLLDAMSAELPWMGEYVTRIDVANIGRQHDLKDALRELTADSLRNGYNRRNLIIAFKHT